MRATDRDLQRQRAFFMRMLGYAHFGQPNVIFRVFPREKVNAWKCAPRTTDHDLSNALFESVTLVMSVISCGQEFFRIIIKL